MGMTRSPRGEILSQSVVERLGRAIPDLRTARWRDAALKELTYGVRHLGSPRDFASLVREFAQFVPDAYRIDRDARCLHFFEIEVYNPMRHAKLHAYGKLQTDMAYYGIDFGVYVVNKYGHINRVDLLPVLRRVGAGERALIYRISSPVGTGCKPIGG
jgi:hypothetical protein